VVGETRYGRRLTGCDGEERLERHGEDAGLAGMPVRFVGSRRDFLRATGFAVAGALGTSCTRAPVRHAVPLLEAPEHVVPGRALWYATTCAACSAGCGVLAKVRDGRPVKLEGHPDHPLSRGGLCAVGQAHLLGLYDAHRFRRPLWGGQPTDWATVDAELGARFARLRATGAAVRLLSTTVHSPTIRRMVAQFLATFADGAHVEYDPMSASAILEAHAVTHGRPVLPRYRFDRADLIVGVEADFLGTWISPVEFTAGYASRRKPEEGRLAWHVQIESRLSLTGSKADRRIVATPDEIARLLEGAARAVETGAPAEGVAGDLAARLREARGRSLVVCGLQDLAVQILCNRLNAALGNYGHTLDIDEPSFQRRGRDEAIEQLWREIDEGRVQALIVWRANPVLDLPGADRLARVPLLVSVAERPDETTALAHVVCPDHHPLESWGDSEPVSGLVGLMQPLVRPLGETRAFVESLAQWSGAARSARELVRETWQSLVFPYQQDEPEFERFWVRSLQAGFWTLAAGPRAVPPSPLDSRAGRVAAASRPMATGEVAASRQPAGDEQSDETLWLVLYHAVAVRGSDHAYNPWLHELPDPITKVVWDNYASLSPGLAARLGVADGDVVRVAVDGRAVELPAFVQPGQHDRVVAVALGYGGVATERFAAFGRHWFGGQPTVGPHGRVGVSATPLLEFRHRLLQYARPGVRVTPTGRRHPLASTQEHHTLTAPPGLAPPGAAPRPIIQEVAAADLTPTRPEVAEPPADLWPPEHHYPGHRWGMVIDLNACTGCSACVVACQAENNIPVVGKDEVRRSREMHWLRLDRYYAEEAEGLRVAHQPMLCQHCEHAPCETVCPVLATVHSAEGLNQQVYNRCVGTRYCANNCPYKVRRFNWFQYAAPQGTERLVLNPDVTVRSRGVMEKCTFCVQRIQEAKIDAKRRGTTLRDGEVQTACQQSCPAQAIVFGDLNDPASRVAKLMASGRRYVVLEELNVRPSVAYLKIVRQPDGRGGDPRE
jgi:Fe-S-cluster-containing dehydrogenase component